MSDARSRYYAKNRETILAQMKARNEKRALERKEFLRQNPEEVSTEREIYREKYYRHQSSKAKKQIDAWLKADGVSSETKEWLRVMLKEKYYLAMKPSVFRDLEQMCVRQEAKKSPPRDSIDYASQEAAPAEE